MAAPAFLAAAGKFLAKKAGKKAVEKGVKRATGGMSEEEKTRDNGIMIAIIGGLVLLVIFILALVQGLITGITAPLTGYNDKPTGNDFCVANIAASNPAGTAGDAEHGASDGSSILESAQGASKTPATGALAQLEDLAGMTLSHPIGNVTPNKSSGYGPRTRPCATCSNWHKGLDFAHPAGTPTLAVGPGIVTFAGFEKLGGNTVRIQHKLNGATVTTVYLHHSKTVVKVGDKVKTGQKIGEVGNTGTATTGNHLHFEFWKGTRYSDHSNPETFLNGSSVAITAPNESVAASPDLSHVYGDSELESEIAEYCDLNSVSGGSGSSAGVGSGAWGGHSNGQIPAKAMKSIPWATHHKLRADAADALIELNKAFKSEFGDNISITDAYRSLESQIRLKAIKGDLAAKPGTSNHGWGLALDLASGINNYSSDTYKWMLKNAPAYGWVNPDWARQGNTSPYAKQEPWHWEYVGLLVGDANADGKTPTGAKKIARSMMTQYNWGEDQFQCLDKLWTRESQWMWNAKNSSSSAYGIPQSLPGNKMASVGADWETNPSTQIAWGLQYIKGRYALPCAAWQHSEKHNWY